MGCFKRTASKHVYYLGWNRSPAQVGCMRHALGPGALGRPIGIGWRGRWEGGSGWGTHVNPWHFSTPAHTSSWGQRGNNAVLSLQGMWEILPKRNIKANRGQQNRIVATVEMERVTRADRLKEESVGRVVKVTTPKGLCHVGYFQLKTVKAPKTWKNLWLSPSCLRRKACNPLQYSCL